jgi:hypothetical protein
MNLPNYFIADLPAEALLTSQMVHDSCESLKRNRDRYLAGRSTQSIIRTLCELGESWLQPTFRFRQMALEQGPEQTGFSAATIAAGLDSLFSQFTPENFQALMVQDLGHAGRLDQIQADKVEERAQRASTVIGPHLLVHFAGGTIPNPTIMDIVLGLLVRSAQFVKCASGQTFFPRMFAHSLYETEPKLGSCLEIAEWRGGIDSLERELFNEADCLTATGNDETLAAIRVRLPIRVRFLGYGHKVSFGYIAHQTLSGMQVPRLVSRAADDVAAWNQLGCLSPHLFYVEPGGTISPEQFAELLGAELQKREETHPRGQLSTEEAAAIASRRSFYEVRAAHSPETKMWSSPGSTAWTVIFEADNRFQTSCLNRFIYIKPVTDLDQALQGADSIRGKVSTAAIAAPEDRAQELANHLARWGVPRICPVGKMQSPPLTWRHDGRPALGDLITWTDWEQ